MYKKENRKEMVMQTRKLLGRKQWTENGSVNASSKVNIAHTGENITQASKQENTHADSVIRIEEDGHPGEKKRKGTEETALDADPKEAYLSASTESRGCPMSRSLLSLSPSHPP